VNLFTQFKTDPKREVEGVLVEYGVNKRTGKPVCFRVARAGGENKRYQRVLERKLKPYRRQVQTETIDPELAQRLVREAVCETVIIGWEEVDDENDQPLSYTVSGCIALMEKLPDLFADLQETAGRAAVYRADILEADAKN
jgi:hypothetical protein